MLEQISEGLYTLKVILGALVVLGVIIGAVKFGIGFLKQMLWVAIVVAAIILIVPNL